ncbi:hypothetical protein BU17DRAFT_92693 [Hysterangium stoloniferum]|nr:hypothetical protein BU17DRAFT_92693 [Hysterangium stoloniferum]
MAFQSLADLSTKPFRNLLFKTTWKYQLLFAFCIFSSTVSTLLWLNPELKEKTSSLLYVTLAPTRATCAAGCSPDPFTRPGMMLLGPNLSDTRWIPFAPLANSSSTGLVNSSDIDYSAPASQEELTMACPQYMKMIQNRSMTSEIEWAKNKTVLFIGSSHDRNNIQYFCEEVQGRYSSIGGHTAGFCNVTTLNLVFAFWFTYGSIDSNEYDWFAPSEARPLTFERKIQEVMIPWMTDSGISKPDLVVETSLFWDDGFLHQLSLHRGRPINQPLTYSELGWHRSRVHALASYTRTLFGQDVPLMFRTRHLRNSNRWNRVTRIFQLDQNLRMVAQELDIKLFRWGDLLEGYTDVYDDDQHFRKGQVTRLFGE